MTNGFHEKDHTDARKKLKAASRKLATKRQARKAKERQVAGAETPKK